MQDALNLLAIQWPAGQLGLVMVIPGWRCELTFPGLDTEGQPTTVCSEVFDTAVLRIVYFLVCLLALLRKESAFIRSWIYTQGLETCSPCHIVPTAFVLLVI